MSCSPIDLKDYLLHELAGPRRADVEEHVQNCAACREELDRLRLTQTALMSLGEEEMPRRIAFVSDPVFEPPLWRRAWGGFWGSGPRLGFASAALLSIAILVSALTRPAPAPVTGTVTVVRDAGGIGADEVDRRIQAAVASSEARQNRKAEELVKRIADRDRRQMEALRLAAAQEVDYYQHNERVLAANYSALRPLEGEAR